MRGRERTSRAYTQGRTGYRVDGNRHRRIPSTNQAQPNQHTRDDRVHDFYGSAYHQYRVTSRGRIVYAYASATVAAGLVIIAIITLAVHFSATGVIRWLP